jgi:AAA domain
MLTLQEIQAAIGGEIHGNMLSAPGPGHSAKDRSMSVWCSDKWPSFKVTSHAGDDWKVCQDHIRAKLDIPDWKPKNDNAVRQANEDRIAGALKLAIAGTPAPTASKFKIVRTYDYVDADGTLLYQNCRLEPKDFRQRKPDGKGGWIWKLGDVKRVPYRWPELLKYPDATVFIAEGEKDTDNVIALGLCATTTASHKWTADCVNALASRDCWILQDNDIAGRKNALDAATALHGTAKSIKIIALPGLVDGGDVSDWIDAGHTKGELEDVCYSAQLWLPTTAGTVTFVKHSKQFVAEFTPPDYLVDGLIQESYLYSLTGATGSGKTAITLRLAASVALGGLFADRETKKRRVLYLAAENPDDVRMRWIALAQQMDFEMENIEVYFIEGVFKISQMADALQSETKRIGGEFGMLIVDTGPVFYEGDNENDRTQQGRHAAMLRGLIDIVPGRPAVIANCHPVKNATFDNLVPAGGGNFLNQVDGNLTAAKNESAVELHWQGKFRGVEFAPMNFMLRTVTHEKLKDSRGRLIPTVICEWISDQAKERIAAQMVSDEDRLLTFIAADPKASLSSLAVKMEWKLYNGQPNKMKASRCLKGLMKAKLVKQTRAGNYHLTNEGEAELKDAA